MVVRVSVSGTQYFANAVPVNHALQVHRCQNRLDGQKRLVEIQRQGVVRDGFRF